MSDREIGNAFGIRRKIGPGILERYRDLLEPVRRRTPSKFSALFLIFPIFPFSTACVSAPWITVGIAPIRRKEKRPQKTSHYSSSYRSIFAFAFSGTKRESGYRRESRFPMLDDKYNNASRIELSTLTCKLRYRSTSSNALHGLPSCPRSLTKLVRVMIIQLRDVTLRNRSCSVEIFRRVICRASGLSHASTS